MANRNIIGLIVLLALILSVAGCGGKEDAESVSETVSVTGTEGAAGPELPSEGVKDAGADVTEQAPETESSGTADTAKTNATTAEDTVDSDSEGTSGSSEGAVEDVAETAPAAPAESQNAQNYRVISLKDLKAYPEDMKVKVGTTVEWRNVNDNLLHIIGWNGQRQMGVKPEPIKQGESWSYTFDKPGVIKWFSTARPTIQGVITVEE
jgi:plastocyanin